MRKVQGTIYPIFMISHPSRASQICATSSESMNAANVAKAIAPPPANPFSTKKRNSAGGNLRKRQRGRLVGRVRLWADRRRGSGSNFSGNGFGFQRKIAPNQHNFGNYRPLGRFFLWRRGAPASGFSGGRWEIAMTCGMVLFVQSAVADTLRVRSVIYW